MHSSIALSALALMITAGSAVAKTIQIDVGKSGLVFTPETSTADVGDTLEFHFYASFHTAVQGDFSTPCQRGSLESSGFNSGPINNKADGTPNVFQVTVKDTNPIWFYCSTPSHCQSGMAGVINPPSSGNTLATYKSNAAATSSSEGSASAAGGVVVPVGTSPSSTAAAASSSASASSAASESSSNAPPSSSTPATSAAEASSSMALSSMTTAGTTSMSTGAAVPAATSAKPSTVTTSGANSRQSSIFAAWGTLLSLAAGLGLLVFLMA